MGKLLLPGINSSDRVTSIWDSRELLYDLDGNLLWFGNGVDAGGVSLATGAGGGGAAYTISAGTESVSSGSVVFSNSNNVSFGMDAGTITASASYSQSTYAFSAQGGSSSFHTLVFNNSNGFTFSNNGGSIRASYTVPTDYVSTAQSSLFEQTSHTTLFLTTQSHQAVSAQGGSSTFQTLVFTNSNGISFTNTNGSIAASYTVPSTAGLLSAINISAGTTSGNVAAVTFDDGNNVTFGYDGGKITASVPNVTNSSLTMGAGGSTLSSVSQVVFSNANGVSFGASTSNNGSITITASISIPVQSNQTLGLYASSNTTGQSSSTTIDARSLTVRGAGIISAGYSGGELILSATAPNGNINVSAGTTSNNLSKITFADSNGISFGIDASTITASHNGLTSQSNQALSGSNGSFTFQTATFGNLNGLSFYTSNGSMVGSYTVPTQSAQTGISGIAASDTTYTSGSVTFKDGNGISFATTTGQQISITHALQYTSNTSDITSNAFNTSGSSNFVLTANSSLFRHTSQNSQLQFTSQMSDYLGTAQSSKYVQNWKLTGNTAGTTSSAQGTDLWLGGGNGVTISGSSNSISFSVATNYQSQGAYLTTAAQSSQTHALSLGGNTGTTNSSVLSAGGYVIAGGSNVTLSMSNNSLSIHAATNALTSQSNQAFSAGAASSAFQTLSFQDSNGISFSNNGGAIRLTHDLQFTSATSAITANALNTSASRVINIVAATNSTGGGTASLSSNVSFSNANNFTFYTSAGNAVVASFNNTNLAGTGFTSAGANISFSGTLNSAGLSLSGSVAPPGAAAEANAINLLGANTSGNTTATGSTIGWSGINLTLSGTNASQVVVSAPATSSLSGSGGITISSNVSTISIGAPVNFTLSNFHHPENQFAPLSSTAQGSLSIKHMYVPMYVTGTAMKIGGSMSASTNTSATTASANLSVWMGIYTLNGSTLSLASSGSTQHNFQFSQSASSTGNSSVNSMRQLTVPMNVNMTPGEYWVGLVVTSATTYTGAAFTIYGGSMIANAASNVELAPIGSNTSASSMVVPFMGVYTAQTSAGPSSILKADINWSSASNVFRANFWHQILNNTF